MTGPTKWRPPSPGFPFWGEFEASSRFDVICLARSPDYTPVKLDPLFDEIRQRFVDEAALR